MSPCLYSTCISKDQDWTVPSSRYRHLLMLSLLQKNFNRRNEPILVIFIRFLHTSLIDYRILILNFRYINDFANTLICLNILHQSIDSSVLHPSNPAIYSILELYPCTPSLATVLHPCYSIRVLHPSTQPFYPTLLLHSWTPSFPCTSSFYSFIGLHSCTPSFYYANVIHSYTLLLNSIHTRHLCAPFVYSNLVLHSRIPSLYSINVLHSCNPPL